MDTSRYLLREPELTAEQEENVELKEKNENKMAEVHPEEQETLLDKERKLSTEVSDRDQAPIDRLNLVYIIFFIHGIAVLLPWNMFITANDYFTKYKLSPTTHENDTETADSTVYRDYFMSSLTFVGQIPNVALHGINLFCCVKSGNAEKRIVWSIIMILILFIFTDVLAIIDSSGWPAAFFWITMACVVLINSANGIYQNNVYGMAACLPMKYTNAVVLGQNTCGAMTAIIAVVSLAATPDLRTSAIYYFVTAVIVLLVAFDIFFGLALLPFFTYYSNKAQVERKKNDENATEGYLKVYCNVFKKSWVYDFCVFFAFFVTLLCFPTVQSSIAPVSCNFVIPDKFFSVVTCFLFYNVFALLGSIVTTCTQVPGPRWLWILVVSRALFVPFFMFCNYSPTDRSLPVLITNDYVYCIGGILMAFTNGYCVSLSMMFAPRNVEDQHKGVAGMMAAFSLMLGIFVGAIFTFPLTAFIRRVGSYHHVPLDCSHAVLGNFSAANTPRYENLTLTFL